MSDELKAGNAGTARPAGKRQIAGVSTTSSAAYAAKKQIATTAVADDDSADKKNVVQRFFGAIPEVVAELKKVIWPTGRQMLVYTTVVFGFLIFLTALVWGVDTLGGLGVEWAFTR